jgi:hypothetical protein
MSIGSFLLSHPLKKFTRQEERERKGKRNTKESVRRKPQKVEKRPKRDQKWIRA